MRQLSYESQCAGSEAVHFCSECPGDRVREFARTRSAFFIKKAYYNTLIVDPTDKDLWNAGISSGDIIICPQTSGNYDPGDPKELKGYGDLAFNYGPRAMKLVFNDPDYLDNYAFYNEISSRNDLIPGFRTSSLVHIFDTPASIKAKDPVDDDLEAEVVWQVECDVTSINIPSKHQLATIEDVFTCTGGVAPQPFTFYFGYGSIPTDNSEIIAGTSGTANHNAKATVPDFANVSDAILWYAEPITEPIKTKWYNTITNNGNIGDDETFLNPVTVGGYRVYASGFETTFSGPAPVEFRTS